MNAKLDLTIRCGFELIYSAAAPTPAILKIQPRFDPWQRNEKEQLTFSPSVSYQMGPALVNPGDPIDMSKRLDGTPALRYPPRIA